MGILNSEGPEVTGEENFLKMLKGKYQINTIFDIGANDGGYSQTLRKYFPKAKIYAFEPHPLTFKLLKKSSLKNKINAYNLGAGDKEENTKIWDFADDAVLKSTQPTSTLASLYRDVIEGYHMQKGQAFPIRIITLDRFLKEKNIPSIDFLKIDTEGSEYKVLLGARKSLASGKVKIIQFEFNEMNAYSRTFFKDFFDLLNKYNLYRLLPKGMIQIKSYRPVEDEIFAFQNIVAILKTR